MQIYLRWEKLVGISRKMKRKSRESFNLPASSLVARPPPFSIPENEDRKRRKQEQVAEADGLVENSLLQQIMGTEEVSWWVRK